MKNLYLPNGTILRGRNNTYTIEKVLGQGAFGITYLGTTRMKLSGPLGTIDTDVNVAIKEFFMSDINGRSSSQVTCSSQGGQYDYYRRKFKSEADSLSKLKHENIVNVFESFEANNTVYYVMEYISGGSLNDYISKKRRLGEDETIGIALQICSALSYMHGRRMLHLDLKPGNVMLNSDGHAVLIDFGLAKQFDSNGNPESSTTIGHGTPGYAPLEQSNYNEDRHHGFPSTMDIYALGGTMFKMLTGKCPPPSSDILNEGFPAYELQNSGASESIIGIISRAMSPMVASRYQSADEMVDDILLAYNKQNFSQFLDKNNNQAPEELEVLNVETTFEKNVKNNNVQKEGETSESKSIPKSYLKRKINIKKIIGFSVVATVIISFFLYIGVSGTDESNYSRDNVSLSELEERLKNETLCLNNVEITNINNETFKYTGPANSENMPEGEGTGVYKDGTYKGIYENGVRNGKGTFVTADRTNKFDGTFYNDKYNKGRLTFDDGSYYEGTFSNNNFFDGQMYTKEGLEDYKMRKGEPV